MRIVLTANGRTVNMKKLIELDAAIKETWKDTGYTDPLNVMTAIRDRLKALPTVDAVQVRHGRWTDKDGGIATCSVCGDRWGVWSVMQYCPSCGARVDGKDGDNDTD